MFAGGANAGEERLILDEPLHLRSGDAVEWSEFPRQPDARSLDIGFASEANREPWTLCLWQQDVKQSWTVTLNDKVLGRLVRDENRLAVCFAVPPRTSFPR